MSFVRELLAGLPLTGETARDAISVVGGKFVYFAGAGIGVIGSMRDLRGHVVFVPDDVYPRLPALYRVTDSTRTSRRQLLRGIAQYLVENPDALGPATLKR